MCTLPSIRNRYARRGCGIWIVSSEDRWHRPSDHNPNGSRPAASGQAGLGRAAIVCRAIGRDPCQYGGTAERPVADGDVSPNYWWIARSRLSAGAARSRNARTVRGMYRAVGTMR